jgi:conjugal transfer/type IV secretion protein DotA/TraY
MHISPKKIAKYTLMPGILPRIKLFFVDGLRHIAVYIAYLFRSARLLPATHPYLMAENAGRFGIRHVIVEAWQHLSFKRENADQIVIFFCVVLGLILLAFQFFAAIFLALIPMAQAAGIGDTVAYFLGNSDTENDIAYIMLNRVFGYEKIFECIAGGDGSGTGCSYEFMDGDTSPFHQGLHELFLFYNYGLLAIALIGFIYLITTIVAETAKSGAAFGQRFNKFWAPIRLIIVLALLTPFGSSYNLNGAQYVTLHIAKWGSNLGTNGWRQFTDANSSAMTPLGDPAALMARPNSPTVNTLIEFVYTANTCVYAYWDMKDLFAMAYAVGPQLSEEADGSGAAKAGRLSLGLKYDERTPYSDVLDFVNELGMDEVRIVFGEYKDTYSQYQGSIRPICGELTMPLPSTQEPGAVAVQEAYYDLIMKLWGDEIIWDYTSGMSRQIVPAVEKNPYPSRSLDMDAVLLEYQYFNDVLYNPYDPENSLVNKAVSEQVNNGRWEKEFDKYGWAGAALWYNTIAEMNGAVIESVFKMPTGTKYPEVLEAVEDQRKAAGAPVSGRDRFNPILPNGQVVDFKTDREQYIAMALYYAQSFWFESYEVKEQSMLQSGITALFGLDGLMDMQENSTVHPLAQLVGIGKSLIESAVNNFGASFASFVGGGIANVLDASVVSKPLFATSGFLSNVAIIGLSIGFILYYLLPFLPFIYFFFALSTWVKSIFEAMVGLPLWALAHMHVDGDGLPGPKGMNGYYLILEIFLRPILAVTGLLGSIIIFASQMEILHEIWEQVMVNVAGAPTASTESVDAITSEEIDEETMGTLIDSIRGEIDQLFYTIIYAIIAYMLATSSFKLIDIIPNQILRWMGAGVSTFGDLNKEDAGQIVSQSYIGAQRLIAQARGATGALAGIIHRN